MRSHMVTVNILMHHGATLDGTVAPMMLRGS